MSDERAVISKLHEALAFLRCCELSGERGADHPVVIGALEASHELANVRPCGFKHGDPLPDEDEGAEITDERPWNLQEVRLLFDAEDHNRFRKWAFRNRYADSAYAFRRLLEAAGVQ